MALRDRIQWDLDEVKKYLRVDHDADDALIARLVVAVINKAEGYIQTDFTEVDADGNTIENPVPDDVWMWVLSQVSRRYERRSAGISQERSAGGASTSWGPEEFEDLQQYRKYPWL